MPEYTYYCDHCRANLERSFTLQNYTDTVECSVCKNICGRNYSIDMPTIGGSVKLATSEIKTLGHLAQRNTETMSQDQKDDLYRKHNSYKEDAPEKPLPKGMTRLKKQNKVQWTSKPSIKQRRNSK